MPQSFRNRSMSAGTKGGRHGYIPSCSWMQRISSTVNMKDSHSTGIIRKREEDISSQAMGGNRMNLFLAMAQNRGDELEPEAHRQWFGHHCQLTNWRVLQLVFLGSKNPKKIGHRLTASAPDQRLQSHKERLTIQSKVSAECALMDRPQGYICKCKVSLGIISGQNAHNCNPKPNTAKEMLALTIRL